MKTFSKVPVALCSVLLVSASLTACSSSSSSPASSASSAPSAPASGIPADVLDAALSALCSGDPIKGGSGGVYDSVAGTCTMPDGSVSPAADFVSALASQEARAQLVASAYGLLDGVGLPDCPPATDVAPATGAAPEISDQCLSEVLQGITTVLLAD
ncbi:MAG: hypothetical protein F2793_06080 [Actinobacteria bacterium]|uniref:Unannotated protein n=1 Tax=freshwater metagenome TaxID=449393 RepID=A0A6J7EF37_9ZZZZ|nr:hypothetical protein [Actinomycetota bacterium]